MLNQMKNKFLSVDFFKMKARHSSLLRELATGFIQFFALSYIVIIVPHFFGWVHSGIPEASMFTAMCLGIGITTIIVGFLTNLPMILTTQLGLSYFIVMTLGLYLGFSWTEILFLSVLGNILFFICVFFNGHHFFIKAVVEPLRQAAMVGMGVFFIFFALELAGIIHLAAGGKIYFQINHTREILVIFGILLAGLFTKFRFSGNFFIVMLIVTGLAYVFQVQSFPLHHISWSSFQPASLMPFIHNFHFQWSALLSIRSFIILIILFFNNIYSTEVALRWFQIKSKKAAPKYSLFYQYRRQPATLHALVGVHNANQYEKARYERKKNYLSLAIGSLLGSFFGMPSMGVDVGSYVGIQRGAQTGLSSIVCGLCFLLCIFLYPLFFMIPIFATAPVLFILGVMMMNHFRRFSLKEYEVSIPFFLGIFITAFSANYAIGIGVMVLCYVFMKIGLMEFQRIRWPEYLMFALVLIILVLAFMTN